MHHGMNIIISVLLKKTCIHKLFWSLKKSFNSYSLKVL